MAGISWVDSLVSNLVGSGIKPRSTHSEASFKERVHTLWLDWSREADAHGVQGFYGLQALAVRAMVTAAIPGRRPSGALRASESAILPIRGGRRGAGSVSGTRSR